MSVGLWVLAACGGEVAETAVSTTPPDPPIPTEKPAIVADSAAERPAGQELNGYVNVSYTEANADLVGNTNRLQLLNVYATW